MSESILSIKNVTKVYGDYTALNDVSFEVPKGSVFGLLGPNGAGKTSLIRIITNITQADKGSIMLNGVNTKDLQRGTIGYMPEERGLYKKMKISEQLEYFAALRGLTKKEGKERIGYWLDKMNISDWAYKKVEELSKGMQQKIQFIATVMHNPSFLILDEPFSGLDPVNTELLKEYIDAKKVMDFIATLESDVKTTSKDSGNKEKSCGLFGVELPLIIFLGFAFTKLANRKKV